MAGGAGAIKSEAGRRRVWGAQAGEHEDEHEHEDEGEGTIKAGALICLFSGDADRYCAREWKQHS